MFVARGNVYITRKAKEFTKDIGKKIYFVHRTKTEKLGIQVPTEAYKKALEHERLTQEDRDYINHQNADREKREAKACLQGMFAKMPGKERDSIINRAFEIVMIPRAF